MEKYLLKGNISGIQEFIFNVATKSAAKTLKAKSYIVQLLGRLAFQKAMSHLNGEELYEGGGSFFLYFNADSAEAAEKAVNELRKEIDNILVHHELSVVLSHVKVFFEGDKELFGKTWKELSKKSHYDKLQLYKELDNFFESFEKKIDDIPSNEEKESQTDDKQVSNFLTISSQENKPKKGSIYKVIIQEFKKLRPTAWDLSNSIPSEFNLENQLPFWNDYNKLTLYEEFRKNNKERYFDNYQLSREDIIDFDGLGDFAQHRTGTNKIGILKMDVDNLGHLFGSGDLTEFDKVSKKLKYFFNECLFKIINEESFNLSTEKGEPFKANIYPIFSGGDDCFIVGAWDAVLSFARELQLEFKWQMNTLKEQPEQEKQIKLEQDITLSAGIIITDPTLPVKYFSEMVEEALSTAKGVYYSPFVRPLLGLS